MTDKIVGNFSLTGPPMAGTLVIHGVIKIGPGGKVEIDPSVPMDELATKFWAAVKQASPAVVTYQPLIEELKETVFHGLPLPLEEPNYNVYYSREAEDSYGADHMAWRVANILRRHGAV